MKTYTVFIQAIILLVLTALLFLIVNPASSQEKKKIIRVIEVDKNGEKVIKEINVPDDEYINIITDFVNVNTDSITKSIKIQMKDTHCKMDSLANLMVGIDPGFYICAHDFDFDFDFDFGIPVDIDSLSKGHLPMFFQDSTGKPLKIYFREKEFKDGKELDKILEDLENDIFDPKKWDMQELEKDKINDPKWKGNGHILIIGDEKGLHKRKGFCYVTTSDNGDKMIRTAKGKGIMYIKADEDSTKKERLLTYTIKVDDGDDEDINEVYVITDSTLKGKKFHLTTIERKGKHGVVYVTKGEKSDSIDVGKEITWTVESTDNGKGGKEVYLISSDDDSPNQKVMVKRIKGLKGEKDITVSVTADDKGKVEVRLSTPTEEELKMLTKNGFIRQDEKKLLENTSLLIVAKPGEEKYSFNLRGEETGKVKILISDEKGKNIKTEEFDHKKGKTEHEVEMKGLKTGRYFIQVQLNGKMLTKKMELVLE